VSLEPEVTHQTVGGRLYGMERLSEFLVSGEFKYVVLEPAGMPAGLPEGLRDAIRGTGYGSIFDNEQGEVFRIGG
jgi:hypothetical protein